MKFANALKIFAEYFNLHFNYLGFGIGTQINTVGEGSDQVPNPLIIDGHYKGQDDGWYRKYDGIPADDATAVKLEEKLTELRRQVVIDMVNDATSWQPILDSVDLITNSCYRSSVAIRPAAQSDPLAIDLDGDGIETTGITGTPILFDHNADGVRTGTGWVKGDDAWLVLDHNANGTIDSGRELFGVDTLISGTPDANPVYASTGFEALKTLDKGSGAVGSAGDGDNLFDSRDAAFTQVRLWQDTNQDGVSQAGELHTLAQKGIVSIGLTPSTGTVKVASDTTAFNLFLGQNPFYREFPAIALTTTAQALPDMGGSGWVRDLREAMSLGTAQGNALAAKVQAFAAATTRDAQMALLDDLLRLWAETNQSHAVPAANDPTRRFVLAGDATASARLQAAIPVLEVFNGMNVDDAGMQVPVVSTVNGQTVRTYNLFANQAPTMLLAYEALRESVCGALVVQTRLKPYLDAIGLVVDEVGARDRLTGIEAMWPFCKDPSEKCVWMMSIRARGSFYSIRPRCKATFSSRRWSVIDVRNYGYSL